MLQRRAVRMGSAKYTLFRMFDLSRESADSVTNRADRYQANSGLGPRGLERVGLGFGSFPAGRTSLQPGSVLSLAKYVIMPYCDLKKICH